LSEGCRRRARRRRDSADHTSRAATSLSLSSLCTLTLATTDTHLRTHTMTPSPGAGGLGCLLVPLHLLTSYSLVRYFATPQHLENQQKKAQYSLANRVVHYEPVRHSLDPRNTDTRGRADGNEGDRRRPPKVQGRSSQKRSRPTTRLASSLLNCPRSPTRRRRPPPPPLRATTTLKARSRSTSPAQSTSTRPRRELNTAQKSSSPTGESSGRSSRVSCPPS
jgi:hypothetical protein